MAQTLNEAEFWLPPEEEELLLMDFKTERYSNKVFSNEWFRKLQVGGLSSNPETTESEIVNGLTRKIAHSTLQEPNFHHSDYMPKGLKLSGSPQSTLWASIPGSGRDSPSYASRVSSPTETKGGAIGWDLLYAAAEEVARMRKFDQTAAFYSKKLSAPAATQKPIMPVNAPLQNPNMASGFYGYKPEMGLEYQRLQVEHKKQMMMKKLVREQTKMELQFQNGKRNEGPPGLLSSMATWPTIQQSQHQHHQPGSGMRAVFLNGDLGTKKKERTGTGVFLPRRFEPTTELTRKKSSGGGCSVLLPDRVVHALNLNLDSMDPPTSQSQSHQHRCNANMAPQQYDAAFKLKNNYGMMAQPRMNFRTKLPVMKNQELRLPQEWTY